MADKNNSFTIDTYFIITVVAGILYMILGKFWDNWRNSKRIGTHGKHLGDISEQIKNILDGIDSVKSKDISEIGMLIEDLPKSISKHMESISREISQDLENPNPQEIHNMPK